MLQFSQKLADLTNGILVQNNFTNSFSSFRFLNIHDRKINNNGDDEEIKYAEEIQVDRKWRLKLDPFWISRASFCLYNHFMRDDNVWKSLYIKILPILGEFCYGDETNMQFIINSSLF